MSAKRAHEYFTTQMSEEVTETPDNDTMGRRSTSINISKHRETLIYVWSDTANLLGDQNLASHLPRLHKFDCHGCATSVEVGA